MTLPDQYNAAEREKHWREYWQNHHIYKFKNQAPIFSIDTPPPTVSGKMHIGHAFSYTQGDIIARYKRMAGFNVYYPFGTDDNGLPTERLVEKTKGVVSVRMDRKEFRQLCLQTVKELLPEFSQAWKDIAMSCDFDHAYSTIDENSQKISQQSFLDLHKRGYVYRADNPVVWCVQCQTAIAQAEFDNVELESTFNDIAFTCEGKSLIIATTRPELIPACICLIYHPDDERYKHLKGKKAKIPLFNYEVPILENDKVDREKGTGIMMVCTFGDKEDIENWRRYELQLRIVITKDGRMSELAGKYAGMKIKEARKAILEDLAHEGRLLKQQHIKHPVNVHERCGTEIEFLKTVQWFVNVLDHKQELIEAGRKIKWYPEHMHVRYDHWVENLQWDWAISRQRHYGVPFPVWYSKRKHEEGRVLFPDPEKLPVDPLIDLPEDYTREEVEPEYDVMDTWATSSLTPHLAMGSGTEFAKENFPMSLRLQAHEIIRTWAFYTILKATYSYGTVPWKDIVISGLARDSRGEKMSKSKGNTVDPLVIMAQHSTDSLRWWAGGSKLGDDLSWQEKEIISGKRTITKLFNAGKFTIQNIADYDGEPVKLETMDKWLLSKLNKTIKECTTNFENYEYSKARYAIDQFFWGTYCDLYLELIKDRIYDSEKRGLEGKTAAQYCLAEAFMDIIKLFAPFMPHITEEMYQTYFKKLEDKPSVHVSTWPIPNEDWDDVEAEKSGDLIVQILGGVRKYRSENKLGMKSPINTLVIFCSANDRKLIDLGVDDLQSAANVNTIEWQASEGLTWDIR